MSIEDRVERIRAEQKANVGARNRLIEVKKAEFTTHARFVNSRLENLRELKVVGIIEEFTKSSVSPIFIRDDYIPEPEPPLPGPLKWPTAEQFGLSFHEDTKPGDFWLAHVLPPVLDLETLDWDRNLRIQIDHHLALNQPMRLFEIKVGWVDLVWENKHNILKIEGETQTYRDVVTKSLIINYSYNLNYIEQAIAKAVVDPKTELPRMRHFDRHTPIGAQ